LIPRNSFIVTTNLACQAFVVNLLLLCGIKLVKTHNKWKYYLFFYVYTHYRY